jgi:signal transduction histidine kinase
VVSETVEEMNGLVKKEQQIFYKHKGESLVISDKKLIKNILINLISNAIKFSDESSGIHVNSCIEDSVFRISVKDEGLGIAEEDREHLFSSFFRGKNVLNIQGTGLGLHIVKRYVDLLNGLVDLESELGTGTTITITLPAKK